MLIVSLFQGYRFLFETFLQQRQASFAVADSLYQSGSRLVDVLADSSNFNLTWWTANGYDRRWFYSMMKKNSVSTFSSTPLFHSLSQVLS